MPLEQFAVEAVDAHLHGLAGVHMPQLGFLEVGHHIGIGQGHHGEDLAARRHIGAHPYRALTDHAIHRRDDARVRELIAGHFERCLSTLESTFGGIALGGEDFHLLALCRQHRRGIGQARGGLVDAGLGLLGVLHGSRAYTGEVVVAVQFVFDKSHLARSAATVAWAWAITELWRSRVAVAFFSWAWATSVSASAAWAAARKSRSSINANSWPALTRWLSSTSTSLIKPATRGATKVKSAATKASLVVWRLLPNRPGATR